jgi:hypothetical protein
MRFSYLNLCVRDTRIAIKRRRRDKEKDFIKNSKS